MIARRAPIVVVANLLANDPIELVVKKSVLEERKLDESAEAAAAQANDPNLGLHLATRLPRGSYGLLEYIGRSASSGFVLVSSAKHGDFRGCMPAVHADEIGAFSGTRTLDARTGFDFVRFHRNVAFDLAARGF